MMTTDFRRRGLVELAPWSTSRWDGTVIARSEATKQSRERPALYGPWIASP
jgi:hypothetical protein